MAPGVPEASDAYELTPHGVQSLRHLRVAGGVRVTLPEFGLTAQVLLAHDLVIVDAVNRRAEQIGRRTAELQRNLAVHKFNTVQAIAGQLAARTPAPRIGRMVGQMREKACNCATGNSLPATPPARPSMPSAPRGRCE